MKTTKNHFQIFKKECQKWIAFFGLYGWRYSYFHEDTTEDWRASVRVSIDGRTVSLFLHIDWKDDVVTERAVRESAFHEICEILLWRLASMAFGNLRFSPKECNEETHNIIRILENKVFNRGKKK